MYSTKRCTQRCSLMRQVTAISLRPPLRAWGCGGPHRQATYSATWRRPGCRVSRRAPARCRRSALLEASLPNEFQTGLAIQSFSLRSTNFTLALERSSLRCGKLPAEVAEACQWHHAPDGHPNVRVIAAADHLSCDRWSQRPAPRRTKRARRFPRWALPSPLRWTNG